MKISLITFHDTANLGATLQCAALCRVLRGMGHEPQVIDYQPAYVRAKKGALRELRKVRTAPRRGKALVKGAAYAAFAPAIRRRERRFADFIRENLPLSRLYRDSVALERQPPEADFYLCGSDQIWNSALTGGRLDPAFFLRFAPGKPRAAYGVSLGEMDPAARVEELKALSAELLALSARESSSARQLSALLRRPVSRVLDCALLLEQDDYAALERPTPLPARPYLLLYNVQNSPAALALAERLCRERDLALLDISPNPFARATFGEKRLDVGPGEFLTLMRNAAFVVTNSYHGTVFSLVYERPFLAVPHSSRGGRTLELLSLAGLEDRAAWESGYVERRDLDFAPVRRRLAEERAASLDYLRTALSGRESAPRSAPETAPPAAAGTVPALTPQRVDCCGCGACENVCPQRAIVMAEDEEGFPYPRIREDDCVRCGLCLRVCRFKQDLGRPRPAPGQARTRVYAARLKDQAALRASSSGGAFTALSEIFLRRGDPVVCVQYDEALHSPVFRLVTEAGQRDLARGSKYVQAQTGELYRRCADYLRQAPERQLLFFGLGCQAAAFKRFMALQGLDERVVTADLICHGAPSPGFWRDYVRFKSRGGALRRIDFRDKAGGWSRSVATALLDGAPISLQDYRRLYSSRNIIRPACFRCPYTRTDRDTDLTLGDFWHIEKTMPDFFDERGVSLVLTHTAKGEALFDQARQAMDWRESDLASCLQDNLRAPTALPGSRDAFWADYRALGMEGIVNKYGRPQRRSARLLRQAWQLLRRL